MRRTCECGCGMPVSGKTRHGKKRFVSGHNFRVLKKSKSHRAAIASGQRRAWRTKRKRLPIGTRRTNADGYVVVKMVAGAGRWKLEHVIVAERVLGRDLLTGEVVHHINGEKTDNSESNLFVCDDRSQHNKVHRSMASTLRKFIGAGLIRFKDGAYEAVL